MCRIHHLSDDSRKIQLSQEMKSQFFNIFSSALRNGEKRKNCEKLWKDVRRDKIKVSSGNSLTYRKVGCEDTLN